MNVEDLIRLLNNRLREFKLSQNYATMSGDLERVVAADKEIIALEETLFKLNLLVDASKSAAVKETILSETIVDGSVAVLGEYDITPYATDPLHEEKVMTILSNMGVMDTAEQIEGYIRGKYLSSPVTGEMVMSAAAAYAVDARLMMAIMEQDSRFGTQGLAVRTLNPGNVGNDDDGNTRTYDSWQEGVTAVAEWLNRHRVSGVVTDLLEEAVTDPIDTSIAAGQATSTSVTTTSTTTTTTTIPATATSTTPFIEPATSTATPAVATSTSPFIEPVTSTTPFIEPVTSTSTPATSTTTPAVATSTTPFIEPIISTTTPTTATSTTTSTIITATSTTPFIEPVTSTTTPVVSAVEGVATTTAN